MMASYAADAEARMRQELGLLTDRLQALEASAASKMAALEVQLAAETQPQRQQAIIRAQRLVQVRVWRLAKGCPGLGLGALP